jgi:hypothetical protein
MDSSQIYYTIPKKTYRVLYATSTSSESGVGYGPDIEGMRTIVSRWESVHKDSASWAIQEGRDGDWRTVESNCYPEGLIK